MLNKKRKIIHMRGLLPFDTIMGLDRILNTQNICYFALGNLKHLFYLSGCNYMTGICKGESFWVLHLQIWQQDDRRIGEQEETITTIETGVVKTKLCLNQVSNHFGICCPPLSLFSEAFSFQLLGHDVNQSITAM